MGSNGDVVVLDSNPYEIDWNLAKPSVTMTILAGNIVFEKSTTA
jgi:predicted amidohydrolase YtcJ